MKEYRLLMLLSCLVTLHLVTAGLFRDEEGTSFSVERRFKRSSFRPRYAGCRSPPSGYPRNPLVFLTVSALAWVTDNGTNPHERLIELNWKTSNPGPTDWVGLFTTDPNTIDNIDISKSVAYVTGLLNNPSGNFTTNIQFERANFTEADLQTSGCLGPYIAYLRDNSPLVTDCLKIQPTWMADDRAVIGNIPLRMLMIPGTHDSGSYEKYRGQQSENIVNRYVMCQDEDFFHQLIYGIRHLDIRVAYYPDTPEVFWLNHDAFKVNPLANAIQDIKKFVNSTREVVILDFHRFPIGFHSEAGVHQRLINYLIRELGDFMIPRNATGGIDVTLNQAAAMDKRLLVSYSDNIYNVTHLLWPGLNQRWADTSQMNALQQFLDNNNRRVYDYFWAGMAELTASALDIIVNPNGSIRRYADKSNKDVTQWYRELWWDKTNIVAVDYFHATDIIEVAREANKQRKSCFDRMSRRMARI